MIKNSFILPILLLVIGTYAQDDNLSRKKSYFGVRAGVNFLKGSNYENHTSNLGIGYQISGLVNLPMGKSNFSFQPELVFIKVNSNQTDLDLGYSNVQITRIKEYSSNILLIPLNFRYLIKNKVGIEIGPSLGYRFSGKSIQKEIIYEYSTGNTSSYTYENNSESTRSFTGLLNFGTDYNITKKVNIGFKYYFAIGGFENSNKIMENSVFSFNLGYNFIK